MTPLRQRMIDDMRLVGLSDGTQQVYLDAVARLARHSRPPAPSSAAKALNSIMSRAKVDFSPSEYDAPAPISGGQV
jgi:hypothetical protein